MEKSMREVFGKTLVEFGGKYPNLVVLDADVSSSTQTCKFAEAYPDRFFNMGVAEADMAGTATGLAACGYHPVISAFAIFLALKSTDQIRNAICYNNLPVVIVGGYAGLSDSFDGASHQSLTDIAVMRSFPHMTVLAAADADDVPFLLQQAMDTDGPVYIRLSRNPAPVLGKREPLTIGKALCLREGDALTIGVCGILSAAVLRAAERLEGEGISVEVLDIGSIKPLDSGRIVESVKKTGVFLAVEEHSVRGGMGSAVAELLAGSFPIPMEFIGIEDCFTESGPYEALLEKYGLSEESVYKKAKKLMSRKEHLA